MNLISNKSEKRIGKKSEKGFTIPEVIIAGLIMIILSVGIMSVFTNVIERNRGENLRMQALSILQKEVEFYRSLRFIPVGSSTELNAGTYTRPQLTSEDGRVFNISVVITNLSGTSDADSKFKEITITATPAVTESGWLSNLRTNITLQRVRAN